MWRMLGVYEYRAILESVLNPWARRARLLLAIRPVMYFWWRLRRRLAFECIKHVRCQRTTNLESIPLQSRFKLLQTRYHLLGLRPQNPKPRSLIHQALQFRPRKSTQATPSRQWPRLSRCPGRRYRILILCRRSVLWLWYCDNLESNRPCSLVDRLD